MVGERQGDSAPSCRFLFRETMTTRRLKLFASLACLVMVGCASGPSAERFGKIYYLDGAGNWGFGTYDVPEGLKEAGYTGDVEVYLWTTSLLPIVDQLNIVGAKLRAAALTRRIERYARRYPGRPINMIALSAGTGVTIWAIERLHKGVKVNNVILLGSSLSHDYDVTKALKHMTGKIRAYYSPHDRVLAAVPIIGTIDGRRGVKAIGQVGLTPPPKMADRVVNIAWNRKYARYGWTGSHTDCTRKDFVKYVLAKHLIDRRAKREQHHEAEDARSSEQAAVASTH